MADGITAEGAVLEVNTTPDAVATWTPIIERSQLNQTKTGETIDMTSFDDEGFRARVPGLRVFDLTANGNYVPTDEGWEFIENAWLDGEMVEMRGLWLDRDGDQVGWQSEMTITNVGETANVGDKVETGLSFAGNGRPTKLTVPAP